jgi:hypothetical protein
VGCHVVSGLSIRSYVSISCITRATTLSGLLPLLRDTLLLSMLADVESG